MAIAIDASTPVEIKLANSTATTATTASFSPPAGSLVRILVNFLFDANTTTGPTVTCADSHSNTYTAGPTAYDGGATGAYQFQFYYATAPGSTTVTVTRTVATTAAGFYVKPYVLTGCASSQTGAATASNHAQTGTALTTAITPTVLNSWVMASLGLSGNVAITSSNLTQDATWADGGDGSATGAGHAATSALTSETLGWTIAASGPFWSLSLWEALPVASPVITTTSLPIAYAGAAYSQTLAATSGTTPYTWSVSSGSLPSWASLNTSTGAITGTPASTDTGSTFTVQVSDANSLTATQSLTLDLNPNAKLGTPAIPGKAQPGNFIPGQVNVSTSGTTANAGLAAATGTAKAPAIALTVKPGAAVATGSASAPAITAKPVPGAAVATGVPKAPAVSLTVPGGLASGTGSALSPPVSLTVPTGSAAAAGVAFNPVVTLAVTASAGVASATGAAQPPSVSLAVPAGAAAATGAANAPAVAIAVPAGLAAATGTAYNPGVTTAGSATANAGLAAATGVSQGPAVAVTAPAGGAAATGASLSSAVTLTVKPAAATATGTAQAPATGITVPAGLAAATGSAFNPAVSITVTASAGLAAATGSAFNPAVSTAVTALAGLAAATGTAKAPAISVAVPAGLSSATGSAKSPAPAVTVFAGGASATGSAFAPSAGAVARRNVDYTGSTLSNLNTLGGTVSVAALGGTLSVTANTLTGTAAVTANTLGGTVSVATLDGTLAVTSDTHTGTLSVAVNTFSGTTAEDKMQEVDIILNEFNDATVTFQILNNASPMNITGMTVNALFKKTRGDLDSAGTTVHYSSGGGSPAITINTPTTGSCTLAIPDTDVIFPNWTFYRIDVVNGTVQTTAIFGTVTITQL